VAALQECIAHGTTDEKTDSEKKDRDKLYGAMAAQRKSERSFVHENFEQAGLAHQTCMSATHSRSGLASAATA